MAIRMRRGPYADMDPTKMIPGEWAVAIDSDTSKQVIWMCFAPGIVKRMGTYEDFKKQIADATEDIKTEYLEEFQAIIDQVEKLAEETGTNTDTVVQIRDNTVNTYLPQMLKYLENAAAASNTATLQAQAASTSASAAKVSEENTKSYMERAFSATPEGYDALVDNVNMLDIQTTTDATLYGSKSGGLRVNHMVGNTEQKTLSGKNLLDCGGLSTATIYGVTFTPVYDSNGSLLYVNANGTATANAIFDLPINNMQVSEECIVTDGVGNFDSAYVQLYVQGGSHTYYSNGDTLETGVVIEKGYVAVFSGHTANNQKVYPMLRLATETDPTYEPYCGGVPAPNPEYPQSIHNTGDCVEMIQGRWNGETGAYTTSTTSICTKNSIPCKSGDKVKVVLEKPLTLQCVYSTDSGHLSYKGVDTVSEYEFTVPSNATKFKFNVINADGLTPQTVGKIQLTINGKYALIVDSNGKNLLENTATTQMINGVNFTVNEDKSVNVNTNGTASAVTPILLGTYTFKANESYILSGQKTNTLLTFGKNPDGSGLVVFDSTVYTPTEDITLYARLLVDKGTTVNDTIYPMLRLASVKDATYEPYTESTATILLDEPLRDEDLIVNVDGVWQVERHSAEVVFDGSDDERWEVSTAYENTYQNLDYGTYAGNNVILQSQLCSHYSLYNGNSMDDMTDGTCRLTTVFYFKNTSVSTLEEWKALLQSNPITVQYKLATPTYEILDTASQIALNSLKTFDTVTHITVDSVTQPAELEVEFGKSKVGAYTLKSLNDNDIDRIERAEMKAQLNELATALVAVGSEV